MAPAGSAATGALRTEQHLARLLRIDHHDDHQVAPGGQGRGRIGHRAAAIQRQLLARRVDVAHGDIEALVTQPQGDAQAHVADADDADAGIGSAHASDQLCISRRLRATDIRMPIASPSETIAVPP